MRIPQPSDDSGNHDSEEQNKKQVLLTAPSGTSQVPAIWQRFFQQMDHVDKLEQKIEEHVSRKRRRLQNLSEQMPSHRRSNVRVFVTHQFDPYTGIWTVAVEGKLLIGNLEHVSASKVDQEGVMSVRDNEQTDDAEKQTKRANAADTSQYRIGAEEETPVEPILFTHLFDKLEVSFRTIYQPRTASTSYDASFTAKKSRSAKRSKAQPDTEAQVNPADLRASPPTKLVWNKYANASSQQASTSDAHVFRLQYNNHFSERPPPPDKKFHSIVADIKLYPSRPPFKQHDATAMAEPNYQIVDAKFRDALFAGKYGKIEEKNAGEGTTLDSATGQAAVPSQPTDPSEYTIPMVNEVQIPLFLSYNEIIMTLFQYIQEKDLYDPNDRSLVICDKVLTDVLGVESINFGYIKQVLLEKNLIKIIAPSSRNPAVHQHPGMASNQQATDLSDPVCLTYVMNEKSTSPQVPSGFQEEETPGAAPKRSISSAQNDPFHAPTVLSFDLDVAIPSLFNYRVRTLLLNVKKREFEYTTCRTKARYMLVNSKGNEDVVKSKIEQAISGQGYNAESISVFLALVRAAHPHSEARLAAQIDANTCDLMERVKVSSEKATAAWEAVDALKQMVKGNSSSNDPNEA